MVAVQLGGMDSKTKIGLINALKTFGPTRYGKSTGGLIKRAVTDIKPPEINEENWFFMTGTLWRNPFIHNDRCGGNCKCDEKGKCNK